jgi:hypothetical protein
VPEEGQNVLPEASTPWAKELPSSTSHSNRSLRTEVSVAGKRNFQRGDKEAQTTLEIQGRRCNARHTRAQSRRSHCGTQACTDRDRRGFAELLERIEDNAVRVVKQKGRGHRRNVIC